MSMSDEGAREARELLAQLEEIDGNKAGAFTLRQVGAVGTVFERKLAVVTAALTTRPASPARPESGEVERLERSSAPSPEAKVEDAELAASLSRTPPVSDRDGEVEGLREALKQSNNALKELHALVWGECPSLLDEDSGGSAGLDMEIEAATLQADVALGKCRSCRCPKTWVPSATCKEPLSHEEQESWAEAAMAAHRAALASLPHREREEWLKEALEGLVKFVDDFFAPWGSWKTAWWEGEVSDDAAFSAENALKAVANKARAALALKDQTR